jgi:hypothetical protein
MHGQGRQGEGAPLALSICDPAPPDGPPPCFTPSSHRPRAPRCALTVYACESGGHDTREMLELGGEEWGAGMTRGAGAGAGAGAAWAWQWQVAAAIRTARGTEPETMVGAPERREESARLMGQQTLPVYRPRRGGRGAAHCNMPPCPPGPGACLPCSLCVCMCALAPRRAPRHAWHYCRCHLFMLVGEGGGAEIKNGEKGTEEVRLPGRPGRPCG